MESAFVMFFKPSMLGYQSRDISGTTILEEMMIKHLLENI